MLKNSFCWLAEMKIIHRMRWVIVTSLLSCAGAYAQFAVSTKAGLIQMVGGEASLDDSRLAGDAMKPIQMNKEQRLRTGKGIAELVFTPTVYFRMHENSVLRMKENKLTAIEAELERGVGLIEIVEEIEGNPIRIRVGSCLIEF